MLCIMHDGEPYGHLTIGGKAASMRQIGTLTGVGEKEAIKLMGELEDAGVFSRNDSGVIFSRRMVRDRIASDISSAAGKKGGGNPNLKTATGGTKGLPLAEPLNPTFKGQPKDDPNGGLNSRSIIKNQKQERKNSPKPPHGGLVSVSESAFEDFWSVYPRKDAKGDARKAWIKAVRKADPGAIVAGCRGYQFNENPRFVPLPATWLNGERWLIETPDDGLDSTLRAAGVTPEMLKASGLLQ